MSTMFPDTILIVFISVCTALLAEGELNDRVALGTDLSGTFDVCRFQSYISFSLLKLFSLNFNACQLLIGVAMKITLFKCELAM